MSIEDKILSAVRERIDDTEHVRYVLERVEQEVGSRVKTFPRPSA